MNTLKTGILLIALTALLMFIGNILGGEVGMAIALILAAVMNFGSYWFRGLYNSDRYAKCLCYR